MANVPKQTLEHYNKLKSEYSQILKRYIELEEERRQNNLVLLNIEPLEGERKTWKVVGGVLVEYTLPETINSLKQNILMLEQALKALDSEMGKRQKAILELQLKYNLNPNKKQEKIESSQGPQTGLLA